jgi:hypothetical protein
MAPLLPGQISYRPIQGCEYIGSRSIHTYQSRPSAYQSRSVRIREKYVTEPDMSERVHYNIWQQYFLALTLTELSKHVNDKCEWPSGTADKTRFL